MLVIVLRLWVIACNAFGSLVYFSFNMKQRKKKKNTEIMRGTTNKRFYVFSIGNDHTFQKHYNTTQRKIAKVVSKLLLYRY